MDATVIALNRGSLIELDDSEIGEVSGGLPIQVVVAVVAGVCAAAVAAEAFGEKLGEALYRVTH